MVKWYKSIWSEGRAIDMWTLNHILGGGVLAIVTIYLNIDIVEGLIYSFILMIAWEIFEIIKGIKETKLNIILDIIFGAAGYLSTYHLTINLNNTTMIFVIMVLLYVILQIWGYLVYKSR